MTNKIANIASLSEFKTDLSGEEKFQLLVESVHDYGIFLLDPQGNIETWNKGAQRIKGYSAEEIIGKHFSIFYTIEDKQRRHPQYELEMAIKHGRYEEEGWRVRKDGTKFWSSVVITCLYDKNDVHVGFAKVTRDLTDKKNADEKLRQSEEKIRKMFEGVKDYAMIMLNPDGTVASWNEGARRIKGYEPQEIIGKHFSLFYPEQDIQMGKCEYELEEAATTGRFEDNGWRVRKDGTRFWANVLITAIRDGNKNIIGFSKVTRDMTERKRADDLLKMSYANLEKRIDERTNQLMSANIQLKDAIRVRDEFLSIASHELRTPLTPLKLQIQSLLRSMHQKNVKEIDDVRLNRIISTCETSISRLSSLIDNLLDISRINMGKLTLNYENFDLRDMAEELLERFRQEVAASGSEIIFKSDKAVVGLFDRLRLEQVFLNLLTNALKYGAAKPIRISLHSFEDTVYLSFQDFGVGIPKKDQDRIFQRFERLESVGNISGLGLGLYITRQIVEAHGGTITVESNAESGTIFRVTLPLEERL